MLMYDVGKKAHLTASCENLYQLHRDQIVLLINDLSLEYSAMLNQHKCASARVFTVHHLDGIHVPDSKCNVETLSLICVVFGSGMLWSSKCTCSALQKKDSAVHFVVSIYCSCPRCVFWFCGILAFVEPSSLSVVTSLASRRSRSRTL